VRVALTPCRMSKMVDPAKCGTKRMRIEQDKSCRASPRLQFMIWINILRDTCVIVYTHVYLFSNLPAIEKIQNNIIGIRCYKRSSLYITFFVVKRSKVGNRTIASV